MKKILLVVLLILVFFTSQIYAADVYVLDEDNYGGPIGGFYSGLYGGPGATASYISGELTADKLIGGRLLWVIPADYFTPSEISVMASFLNSGGRIGFLGAWYGFASARDESISAAVASLGGHISINTNYVDNGYPHYAYRSNDRILSDPLTNSVDSFVYGIFSPLSLGGSAKALVLGEDGSSVLLAYENIGAGTVFVMSSQSAWDLDPFSAGTDNRDLFRNMLYADTGASSLYATFAGAGVWQWNGATWNQRNYQDPANMAAAGSSLYATFSGAGVWEWNGTTWNQRNYQDPVNMAAAGSSLYATFTGAGVWQWNGTTWNQLNYQDPANMAAAGSSLYATFTGAGVWQWNGTTWIQLNTQSPVNMAAAGSSLYATFTGAGVWQWNGTTWNRLNAQDPANMAAAGSSLYATFSGAGVWEWNGTTWNQLNTQSPANMAAGG